ncbi:MAG: hypothetical protein ABF483_08170 [Liquorilactobacillus nagelii]|jgi:hypothetical protein|uniref:DUF4649 domain-containing protein n=1 Tax=Liquorilactobacillus nagelii TaxID=82688 RepID=A0A3S6QXY5_9LACO|nr:hypothetical protein [Liquorilactobacillus nagelii]AUJ32649.1 hypothetical protein BSQ50_08945 [Liquorilactobacillus nagelii]MCC7617212.1 hypothetical protein [Liquorilactobacillus nagelii]MCI1634166.1 hypothetical protein [Liquorilactobacillus nagelii]MCI1700703.1 hypothetical protein [Liquorilactobacillus nagelii]MCP9315724.1 hypothetical protein [Liquorilactobacillus nagelii]
MLEIIYLINGERHTIDFKSPADFVADEQLEVPSLQDHYRVVDVKVADQKDVNFKGTSIGDLYNYFLD